MVSVGESPEFLLDFLRGAEGEGGDSEGGVGGRAGRKDAGAYDEEVGVIVAAAVGVDD